MDIELVREKVTKARIREIAQGTHGDMAKAVVDIARGLLAIGGEMHADAEAVLLKDGSQQEHLWGINLYPDQPGGQFIEFSSLINIRPSEGNPTMHVEDQKMQQKIREVVHSLIVE